MVEENFEFFSPTSVPEFFGGEKGREDYIEFDNKTFSPKWKDQDKRETGRISIF